MRYVLLDAKYRVESLGKVFEGADDPAEAQASGTASTFEREDVYKMHTYRDAIVGANAAIAVYPGLMDFEHLYPAATFGAEGGVGAAPLVPGTSVDRSMLQRSISLACGLSI